MLRGKLKVPAELYSLRMLETLPCLAPSCSNCCHPLTVDPSFRSSRNISLCLCWVPSPPHKLPCFLCVIHPCRALRSTTELYLGATGVSQDAPCILSSWPTCSHVPGPMDYIAQYLLEVCHFPVYCSVSLVILPASQDPEYPGKTKDRQEEMP